ncbi:MAG: ABC transporter ATP-binding protein/permease [Clostridiales bacterium]|jgi:ATP-binding cassette subfamily B protein|nr:ABC transporter ATP-binding protein/permease [Clostridiales bacterium]
MFKKMLNLTDKGSRDLTAGIISCVVTNMISFMTFAVIFQIFNVLTAPLTSGNALDKNALWLYGGFGLLTAGLYFASYTFQYGKTYTTAYGESVNMRVSVAERMRKLPLSFFNGKDLSELSGNMMSDCESVEHVMSHVIPELAANIITAVLITIALCAYNARMALATFCVLPLSFGVLFLGRGLQSKLGKKTDAAKLAASDQTQEYLDGIKVIKAHGLGGGKFTSLERAFSEVKKNAVTFEAAAGVFVTISVMLLRIGTGIVVLTGAGLLARGDLSASDFLLFTVISVKIYAPMIVVLTMLPELFYFMIAVKRIKKLNGEPIMTGDENAEIANGVVELKNVTFAYNKEEVIKNISVIIPENSITALVGPSGSGKSTLTRLIARFWDVSGGDIFIGGKNIKEVDPERLMSYMSFVFQDVVLFNDTVENNIRIGKKDASDREVKKAAEDAHCDEFILKMPEGYKTVIGENGCTLSGGERQRISIARALLKDAPVVLLDEATSSLDTENETLIRAAINGLAKGRTVIIVAHRLKTVADADKILVMDGGRIAEEGNHRELMSKNGLYAKMVNIRRESEGWRISGKA